MKRATLLFVLFLLAAMPAAAQDVVKIGQIEAQTGANAIYGWMSSQGAALAVDEINKAGGFKVGNKTYRIQLIALDTRGEPKEATVQLKKLVEVDQAKYIFYEPQAFLVNQGTRSALTKPAGDRLVYSPHIYPVLLEIGNASYNGF